MRGKAGMHASVDFSEGITPAYAGKSGCCVTQLQFEEDHPRLCGEKACAYMYSCVLPGSPPPMRGKVVDIVYQLQQEGITPAYAGKRQTRRSKPRTLKDHPRLCGEKMYLFKTVQIIQGSPPPMRGKVQNDMLILCG